MIVVYNRLFIINDDDHVQIYDQCIANDHCLFMIILLNHVTPALWLQVKGLTLIATRKCWGPWLVSW